MFDLEKEIRTWKKGFRKHAAMEEALLDDMEWHLREAYADRIREGEEPARAFRRAIGQIGTAGQIAGEYHKNRELALNRRSPWRPARFMPALAWNYVKIALRKIRRQKVYSFINITGLAIGLACFILLNLWIRDEVNWDRFHTNCGNLYRVQSRGEASQPGLTAQPGALGPYLKARFPEIVNAVRFYFDESRTVNQGEKAIDEKALVYADPSVFQMFTIPFLAGDPATAFSAPGMAVLTESAARKYFGTGNPLGRTLMVENRFPLQITGVVKNPFRNSDFRFEVLASFRSTGNFMHGQDTNWGSHDFYTFIQLNPGIKYETVIRKIAPVRRIMSDDPNAWLLTLVPLADIHLYENGAIKYTGIFSLAALFILIIAGCNFVNLATARSGQRAKEIAVRKVSGAGRAQLIGQFLGEAVILALGALSIAIVLAWLLCPSFNLLTGKDFQPADLFDPGFFLFLLATATGIGLAAGFYPALLLSSFRPAGLIKGGPPSSKPAGRTYLRKALVVVQFAISIVLMIAMGSVHRQVEFIRDFDLGIHKENVIVLPAKSTILKNREAFVNELLNCPGIRNATMASSFPSAKQQLIGTYWKGKDPGIDAIWQYVQTDWRYLDTLGIRLVAGRNFPATPPRDEVEPYFLINEQAAAEMKIKNPVGVKFAAYGTVGTITGVVDNYHFKLLHVPVGPLVMLTGPFDLRYVLIRTKPGNGGSDAILGQIKSVWDKFAPGTPFSYEFLDRNYDLNYRSEQNLGLGFKYFTLLGITITCLGLFGLMASIAEQKRKEIAIRKVLGSNLAGILGQINREFAGPVLLANLIAWPAAYWAANEWLQGFAYHTDVSPGLFLIASLTTLLIALFTISFQSIRAARANPVESLKYE